MSNVFSFTGALGRNAELKQIGSGAVVNFAVANSIGFGDKKTTLWIDCALFGKRAESVAQYLVKGQSVFVSGELSTREYAAKDGSGMKTVLSLNVNVCDLIGKKDSSTSGASYQAPAQAQAYQSPHQQHAAAVIQHNQQQPTYADEIPF